MMERTVPLLAGRRFQLARLFSHRLPLEEGPHGYRIFEERIDGCGRLQGL